MLTALGDGTLFGEYYGEGPVRVIWLHGWARTHQDFSGAAHQLAARGVSSLGLDLPGFGASGEPGTVGGARLYADLLSGVIGAAGEDLVLVGHSFGGTVAAVLGARAPERFRSLVLTGAPLLRRAPARAPWRYRLVRALAARHLIGPDRLEAARQRYGSLDYRRASGVMREVLVASLGESYEDELARLRLPVHLLWGGADTEVPVSVAERAITVLGGAHELRVLEGVGHLVPTEAPDALAEVVAGALA